VSCGYRWLAGAIDRISHRFDGAQVYCARCVEIGEVVFECQTNNPIRCGGAAAKAVDIVKVTPMCFGPCTLRYRDAIV
jgi:hypothetical protein